jgi:hypothetical protein
MTREFGLQSPGPEQAPVVGSYKHGHHSRVPHSAGNLLIIFPRGTLSMGIISLENEIWINKWDMCELNSYGSVLVHIVNAVMNIGFL